MNSSRAANRQVVEFLTKLEQPEPIRNWFRSALRARATHDHEQSRARARDIERQLDEVRRQQEWLLNLHLSGSIDEQPSVRRTRSYATASRR